MKKLCKRAAIISALGLIGFIVIQSAIYEYTLVTIAHPLAGVIPLINSRCTSTEVINREFDVRLVGDSGIPVYGHEFRAEGIGQNNGIRAYYTQNTWREECDLIIDMSNASCVDFNIADNWMSAIFIRGEFMTEADIDGYDDGKHESMVSFHSRYGVHGASYGAIMTSHAGCIEHIRIKMRASK